MSGRLVGLLAGGLLLSSPRPVCAQSDASVGLGVGTVRFPGGYSLGVLSLEPAFRVLRPGSEFLLGGTLAALPSGNGYAQGRLAGRMATSPLLGSWRVAAEGQLSGLSSRPGERSGGGEVSVEALWAARRWGVGIATGPASGWILHEVPVTAWRARLRGWWQDPPGRVQLAGSAEPTWFLGSWFTDIEGDVTARRGRVDVRLSALGRMSRTFASKGAALAGLEVRISPAVSVDAAGGNVLPDPYQGFPASGFVTAGIRVRLHAFSTGSRSVVRSRTFSAERRGTEILVRLRQRGAQVVTIAGDWNDWSPVPLTSAGSGKWELALLLTPGAHRFVVFVDGVPWQIPEGVPSVPDGMGGRIAVLPVF